MVKRLMPWREGEAATALMMFAYSFLAMTAYNILKPVTRSQFINALGADNLPYVQLAAGVCIGILMQGYSKVVGRIPRRWVIPATQAGAAALLVVFWVLFRTAGEWVSVAFYVLALILGILLISQFWTLANVIYDARQAKRLFGFIGGGASLGGAVGAGLTSLSVTALGTNNLLLVSASILGASALLVAAIVRHEAAAGQTTVAETDKGVGGAEAIRMLRSSRHLQLIALVIGFAAIGAAIIEQQLNMAAEAVKGGSPDAITAFLAQITFYLSIAGFFVQVVLTSRVHRSYGLAVALLILPFSLGASGLVILATGALWAAGVARVLDTSLRYTIDKTTREVLFLPLPDDLKYRAKPFIDVTVDRSSKAVGAIIALVLIKPWGFHLSWQDLSYASITIAAVWIFVALRARGEYLATFRRSLQSGALAPEQVRVEFDPHDASTMELIVEELSSADEDRVVDALDILTAIGKANLISPYLLHHPSPRIRTRVLAALPALPTGSIARWVPALHGMVVDPNPDVRAAAIRAFAAVQTDDAYASVRGQLRSTDIRAAVTAAAVLADSPDADDARAGEHALTRCLDMPDESAARREAAAALRHVRNPKCQAMLAVLAADADLEVARIAIASIRALGVADALFVPVLIQRLADRALKPIAREALAGFGEPVVDALAYFLTDAQEDKWVRRHIPATIARIPVQQSVDVLLRALDESDGFLRYKSIVAIEHLQTANPGLLIDPLPLTRTLLAEIARLERHLAVSEELVQDTRAAFDGSLLARALKNKSDRTRDRIYRLLAVLHPGNDLSAVRRAIEHGHGRARAAAVEYLDNLLNGTLRARLVAILEYTSRMPPSRAGTSPEQTDQRSRGLIASLVAGDDSELSAIAAEFAERGRPEVVGSLSIVGVVERLGQIPVLSLASVDELFRIAQTGRQFVLQPGQLAHRQGQRLTELLLLLNGCLSVAGDARDYDVVAPAAVDLHGLLRGQPARDTVVARSTCVGLAFDGEQFLAMLSDDAALVQGLFRMIVQGDTGGPFIVHPARPGVELLTPRTTPIQAVEKVLAFGQSPWMTGAAVTELTALAAIAHETPLKAGEPTFVESDPASIYYVVTGALEVERSGEHSLPAVAGSTIGMCETLAGGAMGWRGVVTADGVALKIDRDALFDLIAEDTGILQRLVGGVPRLAGSAPAVTLPVESMINLWPSPM